MYILNRIILNTVSPAELLLRRDHMKRRFSALAATVIAASAAVCASAQCFTAFAGSDAVENEQFEASVSDPINAHAPAESSEITFDETESAIAGAHAPAGDNETATQTTAAAASAATTTTTTTAAPVQTTVSTTSTEEVIWETMTKKYDAHAPIEEPMTLPAEPASTDAASTASTAASASSASTNGSSENKSTNKNNAPQTGDTFPAVGLTLAAVTAAFGAFALRKNNND